MDNMGITLDHLTDVQREVAEIIGLNNYIKLVRKYGGSKGLYIPKYSELLRPARDEEILASFNGYNYDELARKFDLSERTIRTIVSEIVQQERSKPIDGQISFGEIEINL